MWLTSVWDVLYFGCIYIFSKQSINWGEGFVSKLQTYCCCKNEKVRLSFEHFVTQKLDLQATFQLENETWKKQKVSFSISNIFLSFFFLKINWVALLFKQHTKPLLFMTCEYNSENCFKLFFFACCYYTASRKRFLSTLVTNTLHFKVTFVISFIFIYPQNLF